MTDRPDVCPHCGEVRALELVQGTRAWFCNTCARAFVPLPGVVTRKDEGRVLSRAKGVNARAPRIGIGGPDA